MHHLWWDVFAICHHLEQLRKASGKRLRLVVQKRTVIFSVFRMVLFTHCVISKIKSDFWEVPHLHGIHGIGGTTYQWAICWNRARKSKSVWSLACPSVLICWFPKSEVVQEPPIRTGFQQLSTTNSWQISSHVHWKDYTNGNLPQMADIMIEEGSYVVMSFLKGLNCFHRDQLWRQVSKVTKVQSTSEASLMHDGSLCHLMLRSG